MQVFPIAPADGRPVWILVLVAVVVVAALALLATSVLGARSSRFQVSATELRLRGDLYGRVLAITELRLDRARRVDLGREPEFLPKWRTVGTALPGYRAGWFRLRNGEKALLYLTDQSRAVYIPTTRGHSLLLSPADPDGFLAALRSADRGS